MKEVWLMPVCVAPRAGVWIEMSMVFRGSSPARSLPRAGCESKFVDETLTLFNSIVAPHVGALILTTNQINQHVCLCQQVLKLEHHLL